MESAHPTAERAASSSIEAVADAVATEGEQLEIRAHTSPEGALTLLFTDIEGSAAMLERLGEGRFIDLLRAHNAMVRRTVDSHGGTVVKNRGDGFMIAFSSSRAGLRCAVDLQRKLAEWADAAPKPPPVRIGVHSGRVIEEDEDFFGRNVVFAARVADQARGGEILTSSVTREYAGGDPTFRFERRPPVELKGLLGRHEVFALSWAEHEAESG
jgi:class 3 adenylate cyclase